MKLARIVYGVAAAYGLLTLLPLYFLAERLGRDAPPPLTHPEFYYGFVGLAVAWQLVFILIAANPARYRPIMPVTILEKLVFVVPGLILYSRGQLAANILGPSLADPILGFLFVLAHLRTAKLAPG